MGAFIGVENISHNIILFFSRKELFLFSFLVGTISANFMTTWRRKHFSLQVSCGDNISGMWLFKVTKHWWLNPRAGKMKRILCCDWLLERARWARSGPARKRSLFGNLISLSLTLREVKMAGCWSFLAFLLASTRSRSMKYTTNNLANIQPSWTHAWSITHIYIKYSGKKFSLCFFNSWVRASVPRVIAGTGICKWVTRSLVVDALRN